MLRGTETIQEVKEKLASLGLSTSTPGVKGDERLQELVQRLEKYYQENENESKSQQATSQQMTETQYNVPSVSDLSLSEIRSRLTMLGESTSTPGLSGDDRRNELLKRLVNAICRSEDAGNQIIDEIVQQEAKLPSTRQSSQKSVEMKPQEQFQLQQTAESENIQDSTTTISRIESLKKEERIRTTELNEVKKHLNGLINRRAIAISSRYEGTNQDEKLYQLSSLVGRYEQEISRVQTLLKKNKSAKPIHSSSPMVENNSMMSAEKLLSKLNKDCDATKEKIKRQKNRIKCEEENNEIYGLEAEEIEKIRIQELSFQISKIKRDIEKISVGVSVCDPHPIPTKGLSSQNSGSSSFRDVTVTLDSQAKNLHMTSDTEEKIVQKKKGITDPFDTSPGIGLSEDELLSIKPFEPYKETDSDDLLALKMEMLRNRHKSSSLKKMESLQPDSKDEKSCSLPTEIDSFSSLPRGAKTAHVSPEIGSENTAFSARRPTKHPPPSKIDQEKDLLSAKIESPSDSLEITEPRILSEEKQNGAGNLIPAPESKITKLRQELARNDDSDEENEESDNEEEIDIQLKELRAEALALEKNNKYDDVEEIYVKALNMKPFDVRTLDGFATFLHRRKGEMGRAEAFYRRAIQICLPSLIDDLTSPSKKLCQADWNRILSGESLDPLPPSSNPECGKFALPVKRLTSVLLHYATFLRRAKGDLDLAEIVLRKAAEISPTDDIVLGNCAHHLAEEAYDRHHDSNSDINKINEYRLEAAELFQRAMKSNPKNVNNMLWYAKFLHKTNQIIQAEIMYKAALQASQLQGKVGATAICNYAIFLYRHKNDPEKAARLFCDGIQRFPNHRGMQKNYKAMKKELEKMISHSRPSIISQEKADQKESVHRETYAHTAKMAGMRAKLYNDVQSAEDYQLPLEAQSKNEIEDPEGNRESEKKGEENSEEDCDDEDDGLFSLKIHKMSCSSMTQDENEYLYWIFNAGSGSISDQSYESGNLSLGQQILEWNYANSAARSIDENQLDMSSTITPPPPPVSVSCHDHLCFEFYQIKKLNLESKNGQFLGSVLIPIEDLLLMRSHSNLANDKKDSRNLKSIEQCVEETIMSDDGDVIGQMILRYSLW